MRTSRIPGLRLPPHVERPVRLITHDQRVTLIRRIHHGEDMEPIDRVLALLVPLYAQPLARIQHLRIQHITREGEAPGVWSPSSLLGQFPWAATSGRIRSQSCLNRRRWGRRREQHMLDAARPSASWHADRPEVHRQAPASPHGVRGTSERTASRRERPRGISVDHHAAQPLITSKVSDVPGPLVRRLWVRAPRGPQAFTPEPSVPCAGAPRRPSRAGRRPVSVRRARDGDRTCRQRPSPSLLARALSRC